MSNWIDKILGVEGSNKELAAAKAKADAELKTGYDTGRADLGGAIDRLNPIATAGSAAYARQLASLGVNGADAQAGVEREYMADPIQGELMDRIAKANTRRFTSMLPGSSGNNSGAATQSLTNSLLDNWRRYQDQLGAAAAPGLAATTTQAGLQKDQGDMAYGYGATQAGNDINYGNAVAKNKTFGANFLGGLVGSGLQAAGTYFKPGSTGAAGGGAGIG